MNQNDQRKLTYVILIAGCLGDPAVPAGCDGALDGRSVVGGDTVLARAASDLVTAALFL